MPLPALPSPPAHMPPPMLPLPPPIELPLAPIRPHTSTRASKAPATRPPSPLSPSRPLSPLSSQAFTPLPSQPSSPLSSPSLSPLLMRAAQAGPSRPRSLAPPRSPGSALRIAPPRSALLFRKPARPPPRAPAHIASARGARSVSLHAPGACCAVTLRSSGSPQAVCLRTAPSPLRSLRSLRGLSAGSASPFGSCSAGGGEEREGRTIHARHPRCCTHPFENMSITARRVRAFRRVPFQSVPCGEGRGEGERDAPRPSPAAARPSGRPLFYSAAEKDACKSTPAARRPSSRTSPRRSSGRCRPGCRPATCRRGRGRTP